MSSMNMHDCNPPREDRPPGDSRWTCPECNAVWEAKAIAHGYRFRNLDDPESEPEAAITWAEWYRLDM